MADADFGYVGSGPGKIDLYRGREVVRKNLPSDQARDELIALIKESGKWKEPEPAASR
jgi:(E)-4-hydroxy-3-methylbut-2-enyl-diphosphate synthase